MTAEEMWQKYLEIEPDAGDTYDAWAFCDGGELGDKLARLVLDGIKVATASAYPTYIADNDRLPDVGTYSVILWSDGQAACIISDTSVEVKRFCDVGADQAWNEGEGDRSLAYWRSVHEEVFNWELADYGLTFSWKMPVVCESFEVKFKA